MVRPVAKSPAMRTPLYHAAMAGYAELTNGSVWYDEQGTGDPLVLLHGGAVDARFFEHNVGPLSEHFRVAPMRRAQTQPVG